MRFLIKITTILFSLALLSLTACVQENDFYEVGSQPVFLERPLNDTTVVLDYELPNELIMFAWKSKRHYVEYELVFAQDKEFNDPQIVRPGITQSWKMSYIQIDSMMAAMDIGIGQKAELYWTIRLVDPEAGWCDEVRHMTVTRCDIPDNVIALMLPEEDSDVMLVKSDPADSVDFSWECKANVNDYLLEISPDPGFATDVKSFPCGEKSRYSFPMLDFDKWLMSLGKKHNEAIDIYWRVKGTGDIYGNVQNSESRHISIVRMVQDPVPLEYLAPEENENIILDSSTPDDEVHFSWQCDTVGLTYTFVLHDPEFDVTYSQAVNENKDFVISQLELDMLLEQEFGMVPSQKKKLLWSVIPSEMGELCYMVSDPRPVIVSRFEPSGTSAAIVIGNAPADGTAYVLEYADKDKVLAEIDWTCTASGVIYGIEYSLFEDMSESKIYRLGGNGSFQMTSMFMDMMLSDLGESYRKAEVYWRIVSMVSTRAEPSDIHNFILTGMLRPFVDNRDPESPEEYEVVRIGEDFWMAENIRAEIYSDGTAIDTVDPIDGGSAIKTWSGNPLLSPDDLVLFYYTWPAAIRDYESATSSETDIHQGICPDGWHVSTIADWRYALSVYPDGKSFKSELYWSGSTGGNNLSGLNIIPNGYIWHGRVSDSPLETAHACFWTPSAIDSQTSYMYCVYADDGIGTNPYPSAPFFKGDATASRLAPVRCVRDRKNN